MNMDNFKKYFYDSSFVINEKEETHQYIDDICYLLMKSILTFELFLNDENNEETKWYKENHNINDSFEFCHFYIIPIIKKLETFINEFIVDDFFLMFAMESLGNILTLVSECLTEKNIDYIEIKFLKKIQILQMTMNKGIAIKNV